MSDTQDPNKLAKIAFGDELRQFAEAGAQEAAVAKPPPPIDGTIDRLIVDFEDAAQTDDAGVEFWFARDLQKLLGYSDYRNFLNTVSKAKEACQNSGQSVADHFVDVTDMIEVGKATVIVTLDAPNLG